MIANCGVGCQLKSEGGKIGRGEDWKDGREDWKDGREEGWKIGGGGEEQNG